MVNRYKDCKILFITLLVLYSLLIVTRCLALINGNRSLGRGTRYLPIGSYHSFLETRFLALVPRYSFLSTS